MADNSWGSGWPNCQTDHIITVVTKSGVRLPVRKEIAPLVAGLVAELEKARDRKFNPAWCWGFACRAISGTRSPSNHSWGLAVDLDAPENPYLTASMHRASHSLRKNYPGGIVVRSTMPNNVQAIATKWGFKWGGTYVSKPDPMHFEFTGSVADAERIRKANRPKKRWRITGVKRESGTRTGWKAAKAYIDRLRKRGFKVTRKKL